MRSRLFYAVVRLADSPGFLTLVGVVLVVAFLVWLASHGSGCPASSGRC